MSPETPTPPSPPSAPPSPLAWACASPVPNRSSRPDRLSPGRALRALGPVRRSVARAWVVWQCSAPRVALGARRGDAGQSTVEYALVLLGAAAVALALVAWVTRSDAVSRLFDAIVGRILSQAG